MISNQRAQNVKDRAITETKRFIAIVLYLWIVLSLFEIHRFAVLRGVVSKSLAGYRIGFAGVNALVLGKVILIGQALHMGNRCGKTRLIYSVLFKSAAFAVLLICFNVIEEVLVGVIHGKSLAASVPQIGGGGLEGAVLIGILAFVTLIPFFLFIELEEVLGRGRLLSLMFQNKSKADTV